MAGRIVGGDQAKGRTAARREAVDKSVQRHVGIAVDADAYRLAGADMLELRLLEIRDHIKIGDGNDIEQRGAGRHEPADAHLAIADDARDRRPNDSIRSEEHTSELQSLMRQSYAVFCLIKHNTIHGKSNKSTTC